jgi:hypothetical protein
LLEGLLIFLAFSQSSHEKGADGERGVREEEGRGGCIEYKVVAVH